MGIAASISPNDELKKLYDQISAQESKAITVFDIPQLKEQLTLTFKKHKDVIIKILAMRSKDYLSKLILEFNHDEYIKLVGDTQYGKFLYLLTKSSIEIDLENLHIALSGVGINEQICSCVLGVMDRYELNDICTAWNSKYNSSLADTILGKVKKDSAIALFYTCILKGDRDETTEVHELVASDTATELHKLLSGFLCSREQQNQVITTLCAANRSQCKAIAVEFEQKYKKTLQSVISSVFSKALSYGLNSFIAGSTFEATGYILSHINESYEYFCAKYDKSYLEKVDSDAKKKLISKLSNGNFKIAIETYFDSPKKSPDNGNLDYLNTYLKEQRLKTGASINDFIKDNVTFPEQYNEVKSFLKNGIDAFHTYLGQQDVVAPLKSKKAGPASKKYNRTIESYETKEKLMIDYLRLQFDTFDQSGTGELNTDDFWTFMNNLPMDYLGFTTEEVEMMKEFCDWDDNGYVSFDEIRGELADHLITAMDAKLDTFNTFQEKIDALYKKMPEKVTTGNVNGDTNGIAPDLITYLKDSFVEYDVDNSGSLDYVEFWNLLQAMNLGIGSSDYDAVLQQWDGNHDGVINWNEALKQFTRILTELASDKRDHYIGLVDKQSKHLFWYNLKDQSSTWMSAEDNLLYGPHIESGSHVSASVIIGKKRN